MNLGIPTAVILGVKKYGAKKLAERLVKDGLRVVGVGEYESGWGELGVEQKSQAEEIEGEVDYVFDFSGGEEGSASLANRAQKWLEVEINSRSENGDHPRNWRKVRLMGVIGEGIEEAKNELLGVEIMKRVMREVVGNKNLRLPESKEVFRLMTLEEAAELMLRACFLPGIEGKTWEVWGREVVTEDLAGILMEVGKMTRYRVEVTAEKPDGDWEGGGREEIEQVWRELRWQPGGDWREKIGQVMQYFFVKVDEESRRKMGEPKEKERLIRIEEDEEEVVVEKEKTRERLAPMVVVAEEEVPVAIEEKVEAEYEEIRPIMIKNSNMRPVAVQDEREELAYEKSVEEVEEEPIVVKKQEVESNKLKPFGQGELPEKKVRGRKRKWLMVIVLGLILGWVGWGGVKIMWLVRDVGLIKEMVLEKKYDGVGTMTGKLRKELSGWEKGLTDWGMSRWGWGRRGLSLIRVAQEGLDLSDYVVEVAVAGEKINEAVFKEKEIDWSKELVKVKMNLEGAEGVMGRLQARLDGDWSWLPPRWRGSPSRWREELGLIKAKMILGREVVEVLPEILGTDGKRRDYLILFQNENELRPGGGFIGSYGVLGFQGGKLLNLEIRDIYEADGQLQGHVEPPMPIKKYLGEANWYMRDANWNPNFTKVSKDIQWFFEKEVGRRVDGVIGIDLAVARGILGAVGEIYVPDFKEKVNKDNLYETAEFYAETKFFPGSTQKASFLGGLGKQLFEEIKLMETEKRMKLMGEVLDLLTGNEIRVALNESKSATVMAKLGWDGAIYRGRCKEDRCYADYLYIVEANLGVNKANYFVYRNIDQMVEISSGAIVRILKITYDNTSKNSNWPGGDYKNYMRIYLPMGVNLAEVSVTEVGGVKTIIPQDQLVINTVEGKKEVGIWVEIGAMKKKVVEVRYSNQIDLSKLERFSYLSYIQKQSGYGETPIVNLVTVPQNWQVVQVEPAASMVGEKILFNQKLSRDIKIGVEIVK